ncbi:hypothetical protein QEW_4459 [Clostridioides difficile CD160]|nr:hypothetical protein QEW_4459 [Clostridioides difficile CD160]
MKVKEIIFDSSSEATLHKHLQSLWDNKVLVLTHIPVKDVIDIYDKDANLTSSERDNFLSKSNFDFVITSKESDNYGKPLLVIEFDGIGCGYSYDGIYHQVNFVNNDKYRKLKMDCKIKICEQSGLPLIVISWNEINKFFTDEGFTIIDGIIGEILFDSEFDKVVSENISAVFEALDYTLDREDERDIIDSAIANYEVQAMCNVNPIAKRCSELYDKVLNEKLIGVHGFSSICDNNLKGYEYFAYLNNANKDLLSEKVVIREVNCIEATTFHVAKDLAELLLWKKVLEVTNK